MDFDKGMTTNRRGSIRKRRRLKFLSWLVPHSILIVFSATILLPLLWLLRVALTNKSTAYKIPPEWGQANFDNFIEIFSSYPFFSYFLNSTTVALGATILALPLAIAIAYAFARYNTGGLPLRLFVLSSQMLPPVILVLPLFTLFLKASLINTLPGLIMAHMTLSLPFLAWLIVAFFDGDVARLEQAARIDGATRLQALLRIALPVAAPGILAAGLLAFLLSWKHPARRPVVLPGGVDIALLSAATICSCQPFSCSPSCAATGLSLGASGKPFNQEP